MDVLKKVGNTGVVPVIALEHAEDAVPTAKALLAGNVDVMEITFRTSAAQDSIAAVSTACPDMVVGAGTVITLEQCRNAVNAGARLSFHPATVKKWWRGA